MWVIHDTTFKFFDDVFVLSKTFEVIGPANYVILHWHNDKLEYSITDEYTYSKTKDKLHKAVVRLLTRDLKQLADYQLALARPIITLDVVERLESLVGTRIYRDVGTGKETREPYRRVKNPRVKNKVKND
jgi:hypothetical protein